VPTPDFPALAIAPATDAPKTAGMLRPAVYLLCPSYQLRDADQLASARDEASWLAAGLGLADGVIEAPGTAAWSATPRWRDAGERAGDLAAALDHAVVLAARGGHGAIHLADTLLTAPAPRGRCLLIGYSDVTVLHAAWAVRGWGPSLYGFLAGVPHGARARASTLALALGQSWEVDQASDPHVAVLRPGSADGRAFAACLRTLASLSGTPLMPDLRGCILCLEDVDERPYRIDRDLAQLHLAGALAGVAGLVFGAFPRCDGGGPDVVEVLTTWSARLAVPAIASLGFGHDSDPLTLPCGSAASLFAGSDGAWRLAFAERGGDEADRHFSL